MLRQVLIGLLVTILIVALAYAFSLALAPIHYARDQVAHAFNTTPVTQYQGEAEAVLGKFAWLTLLVIGGAMLAAGIHYRRR